MVMSFIRCLIHRFALADPNPAVALEGVFNDDIGRSAVLSKTGPDQPRYFGLAAGNTRTSSEFNLKNVDTT